jgi:hypothetical protein
MDIAEKRGQWDPQRLKPSSIRGIFGMTELMP